MNHANQLNQAKAPRRDIDHAAAELSFEAYRKTLALYHYKAVANEACNESERSL
jgi:hypothetical protein